ncbi:DUF3232 domain-containing protein [Clostridia bacterium]|nr:DUF3232 domain-containing protein [Clostridia bacterium]
MSYEKIEKMKVVFQTNQEKSMRIKYVGDACTSYMKTVADIENAYSSLSLQLLKTELKPFREELDKNRFMALNNVKEAVDYVNKLAKENDMDLVYEDDLNDSKKLEEYAFGLFQSYYKQRPSK